MGRFFVIADAQHDTICAHLRASTRPALWTPVRQHGSPSRVLHTLRAGALHRLDRGVWKPVHKESAFSKAVTVLGDLIGASQESPLITNPAGA